MLSDQIRRFIADPNDGDLDTLARRAASEGLEADLGLYGAAAGAVLSLHGIVGGGRGRQPVLALAPDASAGGSRLVDEILVAYGDDASLRPTRPRGVDPVASRSWLAARQRDGRPALVIGPADGLASLLAAVERRALKFRLAAASAAVAVLGEGAAPGTALRDRLVEHLGLAAERLWLAWEPGESATPFVARWDGAGRFAAPHWTRVEAGADGRLTITDLASPGAELTRTTAARGTVEADTFVLLQAPRLSS